MNGYKKPGFNDQIMYRHYANAYNFGQRRWAYKILSVKRTGVELSNKPLLIVLFQICSRYFTNYKFYSLFKSFIGQKHHQVEPNPFIVHKGPSKHCAKDMDIYVS